MLPANCAIAGLQSGSFTATRFQNGKRPKSRVHFYGFMGNVCLSPAFAVQQGLKNDSVLAAGAGKTVFWYMKYIYFYFGSLSCSSVPQSSKTSRQCGKLDSRH